MTSAERRDVEFRSDGVTCRAWAYAPGEGVRRPAPCIVMAHGLGGTRDAALEPYAERFAEAGFHVLLFDYRYLGASDGEPRQHIDPWRQVGDYRDAITFASTLALLYLSAFVFGFFLLSSGPIGFQYGAEIGRPTPEGTSNGLLLLMGQISGIAFIIAMDSFKLPATGSMTPSLVALLVLMGLALLAATRLRESPLLSQ